MESAQTAKEPESTFTGPVGEKELLVWNTVARPFKRRDRQLWITVVAGAAMVGLILFLVEGFMPVILLISLVFLFYVMNTVEPETIEYKITTQGMKVAGKLTEWEILRRFWFGRRFDSKLLIFETAVLPGRLEVVIPDEKREEIAKVLRKYLPEEEVPPSALDRAANWFAKRMPGV